MGMFLAGALWAATAFGAGFEEPCVDYNVDTGRLVELEQLSARGALTARQAQCLEESYKTAKVQTTKAKVSRVLIVNAYATDTAQWAKLVQRHLDEVDRSDPDIAFLYSFYLYNRPTPNYGEVIKWIDVALERKDAWTGETYINRVYKLHRIKTLARFQQWDLEMKKGQSTTPAAEEFRNQTKTAAREWMDFARSAGKETAEAEQICVNAASAAACGL